jgi:DNA-binding XRE family transcriptional regulator
MTENDPRNNTLAVAVRWLRELGDGRQSTLAIHSGISERTIRRYEKGENRPRRQDLAASLPMARRTHRRRLGAVGKSRPVDRDRAPAFAVANMAYDTVLATLELATVYLEQGRVREVQELAAGLVPIFQRQGVHGEARKALDLFCRAVEQEVATRSWPGRSSPSSTGRSTIRASVSRPRDEKTESLTRECRNRSRRPNRSGWTARPLRFDDSTAPVRRLDHSGSTARPLRFDGSTAPVRRLDRSDSTTRPLRFDDSTAPVRRLDRSGSTTRPLRFDGSTAPVRRLDRSGSTTRPLRFDGSPCRRRSGWRTGRSSPGREHGAAPPRLPSRPPAPAHRPSGRARRSELAAVNPCPTPTAPAWLGKPRSSQPSSMPLIY